MMNTPDNQALGTQGYTIYHCPICRMEVWGTTPHDIRNHMNSRACFPDPRETPDAVIAKLRAELAECKQDAERFRWLKKVGNYDSADQYAIDAARKGEETQ